MTNNRIERDELAGKLLETASSAEDPLRAMAELLTDYDSLWGILWGGLQKSKRIWA